MMSRLARLASLAAALAACHPAIGGLQTMGASWLDEPKRAAWNQPGMTVPVAPPIPGTVDPRCRELARPPSWKKISVCEARAGISSARIRAAGAFS